MAPAAAQGCEDSHARARPQCNAHPEKAVPLPIPREAAAAPPGAGGGGAGAAAYPVWLVGSTVFLRVAPGGW